MAFLVPRQGGYNVVVSLVQASAQFSRLICLEYRPNSVPYLRYTFFLEFFSLLSVFGFLALYLHFGHDPYNVGVSSFGSGWGGWVFLQTFRISGRATYTQSSPRRTMEARCRFLYPGLSLGFWPGSDGRLISYPDTERYFGSLRRLAWRVPAWVMWRWPERTGFGARRLGDGILQGFWEALWPLWWDGKGGSGVGWMG
ncbi:hypothetical protein VUR80DRAFT_6709 [Thermomyces stellatus]